MVSTATWLATLAEVATQERLSTDELRGGRGAAKGGSGSDWVEVEPAGVGDQSPAEEWSSVWPQRQWHIAFEILFCQQPRSLADQRPHQDDLLFFVYTEQALAAAYATAPPGVAGADSPPPLFVRRASLKQPALPQDLAWGGDKAASVDWRASVLLNIVMQTGFCLSVAACREDDLALLVAGETPPPGSSVRQVTKQVHPSPSRVPVNADATRASSERPAIAYPDVCFAVEHAMDALEALELSHPDDCYSVMLHADVSSSLRPGAAADTEEDGAAAPTGSTGGVGRTEGGSQHTAAASAAAACDSLADDMAGLGLDGPATQPALTCSASGTSNDSSSSGGRSGRGGRSGGDPGGRRRGPEPPAREVLVFSGFVTHAQLSDAVANSSGGGAGGSGSLRRLFFGEPRRSGASRVLMRGPEGLGSADVVVRSAPASPEALPGTAAAPAHGDAGHLGMGTSRPGPGPQTPLPRLARGLADMARRAASGTTEHGSGQPHQRLSCALLTLLVPADMLASAILDALHETQ